MSTETPIRVTAEILPGKPDPSAEARFANSTRAQQYVMMLLATGNYSGFWLDGEYRSSRELATP